MADLKPFAGLSQEETIQAVLYLLSSILEKLPRLDTADRVVVNMADQGLHSNTAISTINGFGTLNAPNNAIPMHISNAGANHLYDRITFA